MIPQFLRDRPLTTLLLLATLCVDGVVWSLVIPKDFVGVIKLISISLYQAQLGLLAIWLVLGGRLWWFRLFALLGFLLWYFVLFAGVGMIEDFFVLECLYSGIMIGFTFAWQQIYAKESKSDSQNIVDERALRFSVKHLLIWMTAIAILAAVGRKGDLSDIGSSDYLYAIGFSVVPMMTLVFLKGKRISLFRLVGLIGLTVLLAVVVGFGMARSPNLILDNRVRLAFMLLLQGALTGIWIITVDYDIAQQRKREAVEGVEASV